MLGAILPALIGGATSLIGGSMQRDSQAAANAAMLAEKEKDRELQREFAQSGIRWKVDDAKAAGIHPLYALGANTVSYAPSPVGIVPEDGLARGMASAGQDLSRAIDATRTGDERTEAASAMATKLALEKGSLENDLLRAQISKMRAQVGPPMPSLVDNASIPGQPATRTVVLPTGPISTPKIESTQDAISKEYGDEGLPQIPGQYRFVRDFLKGEYAQWLKRMSRPRPGGYWDQLRDNSAIYGRR